MSFTCQLKSQSACPKVRPLCQCFRTRNLSMSIIVLLFLSCLTVSQETCCAVSIYSDSSITTQWMSCCPSHASTCEVCSVSNLLQLQPAPQAKTISSSTHSSEPGINPHANPMNGQEAPSAIPMTKITTPLTLPFQNIQLQLNHSFSANLLHLSILQLFAARKSHFQILNRTNLLLQPAQFLGIRGAATGRGNRQFRCSARRV